MKKTGCSRLYVMHFFLNVVFFFLLAGFILAGATQVQAIGTCPSDITSYWMLDETAGTTFTDVVGSHDAACADVSCPAFDSGRVGNALTFDGIEDGLTVPPDPSFDWGAAASFSIEFWVKTPSGSLCNGNQVIIGRDDSSTNLHWWVGCWDQTGVAAFRLISTNGDFNIVSGSTGLTDGKWHHVAAVRDGSLGENSIYVDGRLEGSSSFTYSAGFDSATASLDIGWLNLGSFYRFAGSIDEIALHNRALTENEIRQHYFDGYVGLRDGYCPDCTAPVKIMPLGDSITWGNSDSMPDPDYYVSYRQKLYLDLGSLGHYVDFVGGQQAGALALPAFDIDHEGHPGWKAEGGTDGGLVPHVFAFLEANPADLVLLHIGTNDISGNDQDPAEVGRILDEIYRFDPGIPVVLARIINRTDTLAKTAATTQFNIDVAAMAQTRIQNGDKITIVDMENALNYPADMDGTLHPNKTGYEKMAGVWVNALDNILPVCAQVAPLISSPPVTSAYVGWPYVYNVEATGNPSPGFSLLNTPPSGMTINPGTGIIQWTPAAVGNYEVEVEADNGVGDPDTQPFTISVATPPPCPSNIAHYWKLNEATAGVYADFYGANSATCTDCPSATAGIVDGAQHFDAASRVSVKDDDTYDWMTGDSFSVELWMKTASSSTCAGTQILVGRQDSATSLQWWVACSQTGGKARFFLRDKIGTGDGFLAAGTTDLTDGSWHHIVATRDASSATINIYVDGMPEEAVSAPYASGFDSLTAPLTVGYLNLSPYYHFVGDIDEVAVYTRALSDSEVLQHYSAGSTNLGYCDPLAPTIYSTPVTTANELVPYSYTVTAYGNPAPTFNLTVAPAGMTINATTGVISWTPAQGQAGARNVTARATNSAGFDAQSFVINVTAIPTYALNITAVNGTVVKSPDQPLYDQGTSVELTATPDAGYTFTGWTGSVTNTTNPLVVVMDGNKNITANFTAIPAYALNITAVNGTVVKSPDQPTYIQGTSVELTAIPNTGYIFSGWSGDLTGSVNPESVVMNGNKNITANFTAIDSWSVIAPAAGARIPSGEPSLIQWTAPPEANNFKLFYSLNNGATWTLIGKDIPTRSHPWTLPPFVKDKKKCLIKVVGFTATGVKVGNFVSSLFTIEGAVKVTAPNGGGDPLTRPYTVEWQTHASVSGSVAKVVLQYTLNGGTTWKKIASLPENPGDPVNPGSYDWTVPAVSSDKTKCLVKVTLKNAAGTAIGVDTSDLPFKIQPQ